MLEPERRNLLIDALRPPPGFVFDSAIGTTFTLDLVALLVTPVAFALFDIESEDGRPLANPIAVLEAVRRHAGQITIYCQAGEITPPATYRAAFAYLEESVVQVKAPAAGGIFHPKVWVIRFRRADGARRFRFLCLSRNLTFDRSWDTVLRLDGEPTTEPDPRNEPLVDFVRALPAMATGEPRPERVGATLELAEELRSVRWDQLPDRLTLERFWPLGHDGVTRWPFPPSPWRMLVISPFVGADALARLCNSKRQDVLVSRAESLDALGGSGTASVKRTCILQSMAANGVAGDEAPSEPDGSAPIELQGLHAKLFVADKPYWSSIWTGSANATMQAFTRNVEFLVELRGRNTEHGVGTLIEAGPPGQMRLGNLLEDYNPAAVPVDPTDLERAKGALDLLARSLGSLRYRAQVVGGSDDTFEVELRGEGAMPAAAADAALSIALRPMTLGAAHRVSPVLLEDGLTARFSTSFLALTAFFIVDLATGSGEARAEKSFLVAADLVGAPEDRMERLLVTELRTRSDLVRLLLLLLGSLDPSWGDLVDLLEGGVGRTWKRDPLLASEALLEPLLRSLARDPERLDDIERLVSELVRTPQGKALLPEGWATLWAAVSAVRPGKAARA
jgi:hypothetical protein